MNGYKFLTAHFTDNERKTVVSYWSDDLGSDLIESTIEVKEGDASWNDLLEHISINDIHSNTYEYIMDSQRLIKDQIAGIAKERGWVYDLEQTQDRQSYKAIVNSLFAPFDSDTDKEQLFFIKLELFELPFIKKCKDRDAKKALRKAADPVSAIELACNIWRTSQAEASPDTAD